MPESAFAFDPLKLAKLAQLILSLVTRDVADPEIHALVAALGAAVIAPSFASVSAVGVLVVKRIAEDQSDPQIKALIAAVEDLLNPATVPAPAPTPAPAA